MTSKNFILLIALEMLMVSGLVHASSDDRFPQRSCKRKIFQDEILLDEQSKTANQSETQDQTIEAIQTVVEEPEAEVVILVPTRRGVTTSSTMASDRDGDGPAPAAAASSSSVPPASPLRSDNTRGQTLSPNSSPTKKKSRIQLTRSDSCLPAILAEAAETEHEPTVEDSDLITDPAEIAAIGGFLHDVRNAIHIMISILEFRPHELETDQGPVPSESLPNLVLSPRKNRQIRAILNEADPRIVDYLDNRVRRAVDIVELGALGRRLSRRALTELAQTSAEWIALVQATRIPHIAAFEETLVDLERLVHDFLVYQTGQEIFELTHNATDLRRLLQTLLHTPFPQRQQDVQFNLVIAGNVPQNVVLDSTRLRQILINLLYNAFKFTRLGSVSLHVAVSPDGEFLSFEIRDTGRGIPARDLPRTFDSFVQIDNIRTIHGGLGLGLMIVKKLVKAFGGGLKIKSKVGRGTSLTFSIPLDRS